MAFSKSAAFLFWWGPRRNEAVVAEEYCWAITLAMGGHAAADQVSLCCSLNSKRTPRLSVHI